MSSSTISWEESGIWNRYNSHVIRILFYVCAGWTHLRYCCLASELYFCANKFFKSMEKRAKNMAKGTYRQKFLVMRGNAPLVGIISSHWKATHRSIKNIQFITSFFLNQRILTCNQRRDKLGLICLYRLLQCHHPHINHILMRSL
jgi:hypothetical protein